MKRLKKISSLVVIFFLSSHIFGTKVFAKSDNTYNNFIKITSELGKDILDNWEIICLVVLLFLIILYFSYILYELYDSKRYVKKNKSIIIKRFYSVEQKFCNNINDIENETKISLSKVSNAYYNFFNPENERIDWIKRSSVLSILNEQINNIDTQINKDIKLSKIAKKIPN